MVKTSVSYSEEELISLIQSRTRKSFEVLYTNYSGALYGVIHKIIENEELAQDILQEVFVKIWNNFDYYDASKGRLYTWMLNIARNSAIDATRSKQFNKDKKTNSMDNSVHSALGKETSKIVTDFIGVQKYIDQLKPDYKILIDLIYFKGYTHVEASEELEIPLGTVKTRIRAAIMELRNKLR